jgi:hypothetical protein
VLGGLATAGHIAIYLPLCDGMGNKVIGGIAEELLWESIRTSDKAEGADIVKAVEAIVR